jgi:hypothetical protein
MKISEIVESEDQIRTYWAVKSTKFEPSIELIEQTSDRLKNLFNSVTDPTHKMIIRQDLAMTNVVLENLLRNSDWQYLEDDADFDSVYDYLLDLFASNKKFLASHR